MILSHLFHQYSPVDNADLTLKFDKVGFIGNKLVKTYKVLSEAAQKYLVQLHLDNTVMLNMSTILSLVMGTLISLDAVTGDVVAFYNLAVIDDGAYVSTMMSIYDDFQKISRSESDIYLNLPDDIKNTCSPYV